MAIEPWMMKELEWELDPNLQKWPTFSDEKYPLKPDEVPGMAPPRVVLTLISNRLRSLWKEANEGEKWREEHGEKLTAKEWCSRCGIQYDAASNWIKHPERMKKEHVYGTCEVFGVTLDYLRGAAVSKESSAEVWDGELVRAVYENLGNERKRIITATLRQFLILERQYREADQRLLDFIERHPEDATIKHFRQESTEATTK